MADRVAGLFPDEPVPDIDLREQLRCVNRELSYRRVAYPKWVSKGSMKQSKADHELNCMIAVRDTLMNLIAPKSSA